jgi:N-methylhydantoinase B
MAEYLRPTSLAEAIALKASRPLMVVAGATDHFPAAVGRAAWGGGAGGDLLDITGVPGLRGIGEEGGVWRFGALTTWTDVARARLPDRFDGLRQAALEIGGIQVQNAGTLAGNICNASPAADGVPCLLALDATVEAASVGGVRRIPMADFITGYRRTALAPDEIVTAIEVPVGGGRGGFVKLGARRYLVISIAMVAAVVDTGDDGRIRQARVAIGACGPKAVRLAALEAWLAGRPAGGATFGAIHDGLIDGISPIDDVRASAEYRRLAAVTLIRDCLTAIGERHLAARAA